MEEEKDENWGTERREPSGATRKHSKREGLSCVQDY
jgi:hypothetical protein